MIVLTVLGPLRRPRPSQPPPCRSVCRCRRLSRWESLCWLRPRRTRCPCLRLPRLPPSLLLLQQLPGDPHQGSEQIILIQNNLCLAICDTHVSCHVAIGLLGFGGSRCGLLFS